SIGCEPPWWAGQAERTASAVHEAAIRQRREGARPLKNRTPKSSAPDPSSPAGDHGTEDRQAEWRRLASSVAPSCARLEPHSDGGSPTGASRAKRPASRKFGPSRSWTAPDSGRCRARKLVEPDQ